MINIYENSQISIFPDTLEGCDLYMGVILQAEPLKLENESDEDYLLFRNTSALIDEVSNVTLTDKIIITYAGDDEEKSALPIDATVLVTDYKTITEKKAIDIAIGDNLVDGNYYQQSLDNTNENLATPVFVQQVEHVKGEFNGVSITLDDDIQWYGIYVDNIFVKYEY